MSCLVADQVSLQAWLDAHQDRPDDMLEKFVVSNQAWMNQEAEDLLRSLKQEQALGVIERGSFKNCRDPVALIKKRLKDAKAGLTRFVQFYFRPLEQHL